jgi:hypothetical protein
MFPGVSALIMSCAPASPNTNAMITRTRLDLREKFMIEIGD